MLYCSKIRSKIGYCIILRLLDFIRILTDYSIFLDSKKILRPRDLYLWQRVHNLKPDKLVTDNGNIHFSNLHNYLMALSKGKRKRTLDSPATEALHHHFC